MLSVVLALGLLAPMAQAASVVQPVSYTWLDTDGWSGAPSGVRVIDGSGLSDATLVETGAPIPDEWPTHEAFGNDGLQGITIIATRISKAGTPAPVAKSATLNLGGTYDISGIALWNYCERWNGSFNTSRGINECQVEYSADGGTTWMTGETVYFEQALQIADPQAPQVQFFADGTVTANTLRLNMVNFNTTSHIGFGEIRFIEGSLKPAAHTPTPENGDDLVDSETVTQLTWEAPLTKDDPDGDPNLVSVDQFDLTIYSVLTDEVADDDPNFVGATTYTDVTSPYAITLDYDTTYFWRVDTLVTWDSNEFTGTSSTQEWVEGSVWQFSTLPSYLPPVIVSFDSINTAKELNAVLTAEITEKTYPVTSTLTLLTDDYEFPTGAVYTFTPNYTDPQNPTATLVTDTAGTYKVKLVVTDSHPITPAILEKIAEVNVYENACEAQKAIGWTANMYDTNEDCFVDVADLSVFALAWLDDTTMKASETYDAGDVLALDADFIVECEDAYSVINPEYANDPNYVTEAPLEVDAGAPRIRTSNPSASGGLYVSHTAVDCFIVYEVDFPEAGEYTVSLYNAFPATTGVTRVASFGTVGDTTTLSDDVIDAYGQIELADKTGWADYGIDSAVMTFPAGKQLVRLTWVGGDFSVDFIGFIKN